MGRAFEYRKARKMKRWGQMAKTFTRIGKDIVMAVKKRWPRPRLQRAPAGYYPKFQSGQHAEGERG